MLDNLHIGLGERDTDSVFLRSYSTLVLMEVVAYDNAHPFLGQGEAAGLLDQVLEYLRKERDLRSWVEGPGWAHAVAHTADLLMMLARNLQLGSVELERFVRPSGHDSWRAVYESPIASAIRANVTSFLRSLYFQLLLTENPPPDGDEHLAALLATLQSMDIGFYSLA